MVRETGFERGREGGDQNVCIRLQRERERESKREKEGEDREIYRA